MVSIKKMLLGASVAPCLLKLYVGGLALRERVLYLRESVVIKVDDYNE